MTQPFHPFELTIYRNWNLKVMINKSKILLFKKGGRMKNIKAGQCEDEQ
jgi:hypothetical protein